MELTSNAMQVILTSIERTAIATVVASLLAFPLGIACGMARISRHRWLRWLTGLYVEIFRGTSALVQLYFGVFVLPLAGITLDPFATGAVVLALNAGSYAAETARGALLAVPHGQIEACQALGLGWWTTRVTVVLPQAWRIMIPSFGNLAIDILKTTSLLSLVAVSEITGTMTNLNLNGTIDSKTAFVGLLAIYLVLSLPINGGFSWLERRASRPYRHRAAS